MLKDAGNHGPDQDKDGGLLDTEVCCPRVHCDDGHGGV